MAMSVSQSLTRDTAAYGGFADAIGGLATIVLAIVGIAGVRMESMAAIAAIVFGVALLVEGGTLASEMARIVFPAGTRSASVETSFGGSGLSAHFLAGGAGIVLGLLALIGIQPVVLVSVAVIAFGAAIALSSSSVWRLHEMKRVALTGEAPPMSGTEILANEMAVESSGALSLAGLAAIVLGILAVVGVNSAVLTLAALIALGATLVLTGSSLSATVVSFMRPATER
jgi:hypothetical protein